MGSVLTIVNLVLGILEKFVSWGARNKAFNEDQSIIALAILRKATEDIKVAQDIEDKLRDQFNNDPGSVSKPDEFTRNTPD